MRGAWAGGTERRRVPAVRPSRRAKKATTRIIEPGIVNRESKIENRGWTVLKPGLVPYREGLELQEACKRSVEGGHPGYWILLRHHPVITAGRRADSMEDLAVPVDRITREGIELYRTDRGGRLTYHHPGQIVGYPILNLRSERLKPREYVRWLGEILGALLASYSIPAAFREDHAGVWVQGESELDRKIASIGIAIRKGVTSHGFALNLRPDNRPMGLMRWCGMGWDRITSMESELKREVDADEAMDRLQREITEESRSAKSQEAILASTRGSAGRPSVAAGRRHES